MLTDNLKFNDDNLIPVITIEYQTNEVLMFSYANREAVDLTEKTKKATYFSRSRNKIWVKGEDSGNFLEVVEIRVDCDNDCIIYVVIPQGYKAVCHTGHKSCFYRKYENEKLIEFDTKIYFDPEKVYKK